MAWLIVLFATGCSVLVDPSDLMGGGGSADGGPRRDAGPTDTGPTDFDAPAADAPAADAPPDVPAADAPLDVSDPPRGIAVEVVAGVRHACARYDDGRVYCWGGNGQGQLGDGTIAGDRPIAGPAMVTDAVDLAAGFDHTCALQRGGTVLCWGSDISGQTGTGAAGTDVPTPLPVSGLRDAVGVFAGGYHTCAIHRTGALSCWGENDLAQLGMIGADRELPTPTQSMLPRVLAGDAGESHTCVLTEGGRTWCWGGNAFGQLGDGSTSASTNAVAVMAPSSAVALGVGRFHGCVAVEGASAGLYCWGENRARQAVPETSINPVATPRTVVGLGDAIAVDGGDEFTCAVHPDGVVECFGTNTSQALGATDPAFVGLHRTSVTDAQGIGAGHRFACALRSAGRVSCWGAGESGQLGGGVTTASSAAPVDVMGLP